MQPVVRNMGDNYRYQGQLFTHQKNGSDLFGQMIFLLPSVFLLNNCTLLNDTYQSSQSEKNHKIRKGNLREQILKSALIPYKVNESS